MLPLQYCNVITGRGVWQLQCSLAVAKKYSVKLKDGMIISDGLFCTKLLKHACRGAAAAQRPMGAVTLLGCLQRYVRAERLGPGQAWVCARCQTRRPAVKQMSIRRLPPVLCLHLKRFEHTVRQMTKLGKLYHVKLFSLNAIKFITSLSDLTCITLSCSWNHNLGTSMSGYHVVLNFTDFQVILGTSTPYDSIYVWVLHYKAFFRQGLCPQQHA